MTVVTFAMGIADALPELIPSIEQAILLIVQVLLDNMTKMLEAAFAIIQGLAEGILIAFPQLVAKLPEIIAAIVTGLRKAVGLVYEIGKNIVTGLWEGIKSMGRWISEKVSGFFPGLWTASKICWASSLSLYSYF